jgi:putative PEP-CTERM system TPR-repeat lipoprotein
MKSFRRLSLTSLLLVSSLLNAADAEQYIQEAKSYLEKDEPNAAIIQLKNALQENPTSIEARLMLGKIYLQAGDGASAEKEFERAKKLNAAKSYWEQDLAKAYLLQRKYHEILDNISDDPNSSSEARVAILLIRGDAHLGLRQLKEARETFGQAQTVNSESQEAMLGLIMADIAENKRSEALTGVDSLLSRYPDNVSALVLRAELNMQTGGVDVARTDFNKAISLQGKNARALLGRANINLASGKLEETKSDLAELEKLVPGHPKLLHLSGAVALLEKDLDKADTLLQQAHTADPNNLQTQTMLGATNLYKGNLEAAHEHLSQVLKAQPALLPAIKLLASVQHKLKQPEEVIALLEPASRYYPNDAQLMAMLGTAYMQVKRFEEGSALMSKAIEISPDLASYRTQLALGLLAQGKTGEAIHELESTTGMEQEFVQADVLLVLSHINKKDYDKALEASMALEKKSPDNPVSYNLTGLAYLIAGKKDEAEQRFKKALQIDPNFITAHANLARLAMQKDDIEQAKKQLEEALKKAPKNTTVLLGLADIAKRKGELAHMNELLERAHHGEPKSSRPGLILAQNYLTEGEPLKALRISSQLATDFPKEPAVLVTHGKAQITAGDAINAVTTFKRLQDIVKNAETLQLLGNAQQAAKQFDDARVSYQQALEEKPDFVPVLIGQYSLELSTGNLELALTHARSIQKALPDKSIGYEFEATAFAFQNKPKQAIPLYEKAQQMQASEKVTLLLAGQYEAAGDPERGLSLLNDWITQHPDQLQPQLNLSMMLLSQGRNDESIAAYEKILQTDKNNLIALNNLAWLYSTKNDKRASQIGKQAYELAPRRPEIIDTYGWILVQEGDYKRGSEILKQAAELAPKNQEIVYHLGYALNKQGEKQLAKAFLKRAIAIDEKSELAKTAQKLIESLN